MGLSQISHLQLRISTLLLNEKSQQFKFKKANTRPGEGHDLPLSCIRRHRGKWRWSWNGKPPGGVFPSFHLSGWAESRFEGALALAHPEDWDLHFCCLNHEKSASLNHNHNYGISDPDLLNHSEIPLFLGRKFVGSIQKKQPNSTNAIKHTSSHEFYGFFGNFFYNPLISWVFCNVSWMLSNGFRSKHATTRLTTCHKKCKSFARCFTSICHLRVPVLGWHPRIYMCAMGYPSFL